MTNPTGNALLARIEQLEEKLAKALTKLNNVYNIASQHSNSQILSDLIMEEIDK